MHRIGRLTALHLFFAALSVSCYAQTKKPAPPPPPPIQIAGVTPSATEAPLYGRIDLTVDLHATYNNPFDPSQIVVDANVTLPSGRSFSQPGYFDQDFTANGTGPQENLTANGSPSWHIRLALIEPGVTKVVVTAKDKTGTTQSQQIELTATPSTDHGFVRVSEADFRYFVTDDGKPFFPIGANLQPIKSLSEFDSWIPALSANNANAAKIFIAPDNTPLSLITKASSAYKIDLANAWRLDQAIQKMAAANIRPIICFDTSNELRSRDYDPRWTNNPFNHDNGGPIFTDTEFWKSDPAEVVYFAKLRYIVARYSAYDNILGWELWHEIDQVHLFDSDTIRPWVDKNAQLLKSIDPYAHLVTVSYADQIGDRSIDHLGTIDFVQTHVYNVSDLSAITALQQYRKSGYGKPNLVTEVGADRFSDRATDDPKGLQFHDPMWASVTSGAAGAAFPSWWPSYVFPKGLAKRFTPVANFTRDINWPSQNFKTTTATFAFQQPPKTPFYRDLIIENGPVSFDNTDYNLPRTVRIWPYGVQYGLPVSGVLQGQIRHASKYNPITFTLDIKHPTQFDLTIGDVSGSGGAVIHLTLDGEVILGLDLADPDDVRSDEVITKYHGTHSIQIPAGHHVLVVADVGNDWAMASYRFHDLLPRKTPPLAANCLAGDSVAIAWIREADRTWDRIANQRRPAPSCPPTVMKIPNLLPGTWRADLWDTWTGKVTKTQRVVVGKDGNALVNLPQIDTDIAVKMTKTAAVPKKSK